jgi:plasmid stabilization system protein ParE
MRLIYHPDAEAELIEAAQFYQRKSPGLGDRFLREFDAAIAAIQVAPQRWGIVEGDIRRYLMDRFPYGIYYRAEGEVLRILVVKHHKRHPDYWRYRLDEDA